jgi:hypothetical protein
MRTTDKGGGMAKYQSTYKEEKRVFNPWKSTGGLHLNM